jgi:anti-sigma factor RsiW
MSSIHAIESLSAYALGCLDEEEARRVDEHLAVCPSCRAELQSFLAVCNQLALATPDAMPPGRLKQQILGQLQASPAESGTQLPRSS